MGTTADLARFIAETHYDDLPAEVVAAASHRAGANLRGFHPPGVYGPLGGTAGSLPFPSTRGSDTTSSRASSTFRPMT